MWNNECNSRKNNKKEKNMIESQKKIIEYCKTFEEKIAEAALPGGIAEKIKEISDKAQEQLLVVPIIGNFSAGKSSMINSLLGENMGKIYGGFFFA
jgi:ribosome biogenesis GTPase A